MTLTCPGPSSEQMQSWADPRSSRRAQAPGCQERRPDSSDVMLGPVLAGPSPHTRLRAGCPRHHLSCSQLCIWQGEEAGGLGRQGQCRIRSCLKPPPPPTRSLALDCLISYSELESSQWKVRNCGGSLQGHYSRSQAFMEGTEGWWRRERDPE